jgi:hypothetical protein
MAFALLLAIRLRYIAAIEGWNLSMASLQRLLRVCSSFGESSDPLLRPFVALRGRASQINRSLSRSPLLVFVSIAREYLDWFMLANVLHFFRSVTRVDDNLAHLRECYLLIANLEADIALARHLQDAAIFCWADVMQAPPSSSVKWSIPCLRMPCRCRSAWPGKAPSFPVKTASARARCCARSA